jgi:hypothetical protein
VRSFTVATPQRISLGGANQGEPDKQNLYRDPDKKLMRTSAHRNVETAASIANVLRRPDVTEGWREVHSEVLHSRYSSENIIRRSKSRRTR